MKKYFISMIVALVAFPAMLMASAMPNGYYNNAQNKTGEALLTALYNIIHSHTKLSYNNVRDLMKVIDLDENSHIYDMYSNAQYSASDFSGSANNIGQGWNREHSMPNSWFGGESGNSSAYTDMFHLYPTDIYVNNQRSNYPFGECANGTRLQDGDIVAKGKLGTSTRSGYSSTVFEPDDEYKGDFARSYFYMATCYNNVVSDWNEDYAPAMLNGNSYPVFTDWALQMLLEWHRLDPVSQKEINRNNAIYDRQGNRNPFIDYPELVEYVWGNKVGTNWTPGGSTPTNPTLTQPVNGSTINMGSTTPGNKLTATVAVKGVDLTQTLNVSISGTGFTAYPSTITAVNAVNGTNVYVNFNSTTVGTYTGTLTIASSEVSATVTLTATVNPAALNAPVATAATNITGTSFTANWGAVTGAQTYTLYVNKKGYTPPADYTLLLDENMSSGTTWTANGKTYQDEGYFRLGTGTGTGSVTSPLVNLTTSEGVVTVKTTARSYGTDSDVQMKVSVIDGNESELDSETFTLTSSDAVYTAVLTGAASPINRIKIENLAQRKRVQLKGVKVYAGDASNAPSKAVSESGDENTRTITGITGTSYTVQNLTENATYEYKVKAIGASTESNWSNVVEVTLTAGQQYERGDVNRDGQVNVNDVTYLINMILSVLPMDMEAGDVNLDNQVNVNDVTYLINMILGVI